MSRNHTSTSPQGGQGTNSQMNQDSTQNLARSANALTNTSVVRATATFRTSPASQFSVNDAASKRLLQELQQLQKNPVEGVAYVRPKETDLFHWEVAFFGAPDTPYQGGYFKANLKFADNYPFVPPQFIFTSSMFHPNVFKDPPNPGAVCISILHPPTNEVMYAHEPPTERWNPTQSISSILISIVSLLADPNPNSIANVDAGVAFRKWRDTKDPNCEFIRRIKEIVKQSEEAAAKDGISIPRTIDEYVNYNKAQRRPSESESDLETYDCPIEDEQQEEADDAYVTEENEMGESGASSGGEGGSSPAPGAGQQEQQRPPEEDGGNGIESELDSPPRANSKKSRLGSSPDSAPARFGPS